MEGGMNDQNNKGNGMCVSVCVCLKQIYLYKMVTSQRNFQKDEMLGKEWSQAYVQKLFKILREKIPD